MSDENPVVPAPALEPEIVASAPAEVHETHIDAPAAAPAPAPDAPSASGIDALKPRMQLRGKVTRVDLGGAFIDVGVGVDGFVHISQLIAKDDAQVTRVADVLKTGDEINAYVYRVNPQRKRLELTMHRPAAYGWDNLPLGAKLDNARVVSVESFGAFVDFDGPKHGLIPFNLMPRGIRPKVGDSIDTAWVVEVDESKRRVGLTMVEPPALTWDRIKRGEKITGKVTRVERNGAWVDIGAEREGMIRASAMGMNFVDMSALVSEGEEVTVKIMKVDPGRKQIDLSLDGVNPDDYSLSSGPEEDISPFAAAFQRAQRIKKAQGTAGNADRAVKKTNPQNDLLDRTIQQMQDAKK